MAAGVAADLSARHREVCERIAAACGRAGRAAATVRLVAVSKRVPPEVVRQATAVGLRCFGENYVQEWQAKAAALADLDITWHFVGRLQRNKAAAIARAALVHSVADERGAAALDRAGAARATPVPVLLQVNLAGEASKGGVSPDELPAALAAVRGFAWVRVEGLMTLPPALPPAETRPLFAALRDLRDRQQRADELRELSMGMSADFEVAIEEGATLIRIGTAIFGPRT
jgi:pyridoxal phosphate enzyme (YggS family)